MNGTPPPPPISRGCPSAQSRSALARALSVRIASPAAASWRISTGSAGMTSSSMKWRMRSRSARTSGPRSWVDIGILLGGHISAPGRQVHRYRRRRRLAYGRSGEEPTDPGADRRTRVDEVAEADPREDGQQGRVADVGERVAPDQPVAAGEASLEDVEMQRDRVVRAGAGVGVDGLLRRDRGRHPRL